LDYATVVEASVTSVTGSLADEPVTIARLRAPDGRDRVVRIVGGPTGRGGSARLAGYVVPIAGARVRVDLREEPATTSVLPRGARRWAPNDPAGTWGTDALPLAFDLALPGSRDLGPNAAAELEVAARTWARPSCSGFRARYRETRALTAADDGESGVFFHDDAWPEELVPGAVAQTVVHTDASGSLRDADIHLNGAAYRFSLDGAPGTQDTRSILVHEIGHALGLGHSSDPRATMYTSGSGLRWRSLEQDDVDGVCALYPGRGSGGCGADPCPGGLVCVAGACQRPGDRADACSPCSPDASGACEAAGDDARCVDLGAGHACGRPCAADRDCGDGFACRATTEAGDRQCVSLVGCTNGANRCATDADCNFAGANCLAGACLGPAATSAPVDAGADATLPTSDAPRGGGSGCSCRASDATATWEPGVLLACAAGALSRRRTRRRDACPARRRLPS
jgi:hypothetical protein